VNLSNNSDSSGSDDSESSDDDSDVSNDVDSGDNNWVFDDNLGDLDGQF